MRKTKTGDIYAFAWEFSPGNRLGEGDCGKKALWLSFCLGTPQCPGHNTALARIHMLVYMEL